MTAQLVAAGIVLACLSLLVVLAKWRRDIDRALTGPKRDEEAS